MEIVNREVVKKGLIYILLMIVVLSCSQFVDKPKNLVEKDKMAEVLAELAVSDQNFIVNSSGDNMESGTRFILKKNKVSAKDFSESYQYYAITKEMEGIIEDAQEIILKKYPESKQYIDKKLKNNPELPAFVR